MPKLRVKTIVSQVMSPNAYSFTQNKIYELIHLLTRRTISFPHPSHFRSITSRIFSDVHLYSSRITSTYYHYNHSSFHLSSPSIPTPLSLPIPAQRLHSFISHPFQSLNLSSFIHLDSLTILNTSIFEHPSSLHPFSSLRHVYQLSTGRRLVVSV